MWCLVHQPAGFTGECLETVVVWEAYNRIGLYESGHHNPDTQHNTKRCLDTSLALRVKTFFKDEIKLRKFSQSVLMKSLLKEHFCLNSHWQQQKSNIVWIYFSGGINVTPADSQFQ